MFLARRFLSTFTPSPVIMGAAKDKAQSLIDENAVVVFSKTTCPFCSASKKLLQDAGATFKVRWETTYMDLSHAPLPPRTHRIS